MNTPNFETPESIQQKINEENLKYQEEFVKGSNHSIRKEIKQRIKHLEAMLHQLLVNDRTN